MQAVARGLAAFDAADKASGGALSRTVKSGAKRALNQTRLNFKKVKRSKTNNKKRSIVAKVAMSNGSGQKQKMVKATRAKRATKPLKTRVAKLEKKVKENFIDHIYKVSSTFQVTSIQNRCGYAFAELTNAGTIETILASMPYINTAAPGTPATFDARSITNPTKWKVDFYGQCVMRNNYLYPVNVRCYMIQPKTDTSTSATASISAGITLEANPSVYSTSDPWLYPADSKEFTDQWTILTSCEMKLQSGDECFYPFSDSITYDQEYLDAHTSTYSKKYSRQILIRVVGVVAHDSTTTTNVGIAPTALDCVVYRKYHTKIPALAPAKSLYVASGLSAMAVAPVVGVASAEVETAL